MRSLKLCLIWTQPEENDTTLRSGMADLKQLENVDCMHLLLILPLAANLENSFPNHVFIFMAT